MTPLTTLLVLFFVSALSAGMPMLLGTLAHRRKIRNLAREYSALVSSLQEQTNIQAAAIAELEHRNRTVDTKLRNTQEHIASVCGQRDFWNEWYHRQAAEHGAAQSLFLQELELHVKRGSKHPLNPTFRAIVEDFSQTHPALANTGQPAKPAAKPLAER